MIKQYKLREINRNEQLHKDIFVKLDDFTAVCHMLVEAALEAGADKAKLDKFFDGDKDESH